MASDQEFVDFVTDQIDPDCGITYKKMFGEYGLYSRGTFFAVICDNRLFIKPTEEGRAHIGNVVEAPPYPGAKPSFLIEEGIEDSAWLSELVRITASALPAPKRKGSKSRAKRATKKAPKKRAATKAPRRK